jgi:predicted RND superfamily exporter protein
VKHSIRLDSLVVRYAEMVLRLRWWVIVLSLLVVAGSGYGVRFITFETDYRIFFDEENPQLQAFEKVQNIYTKNDNILFVVVPEEGDVFDPRVLSAVEDLTKQAWQIPFSTRVDSVTNFQYSYAEGDELIVGDLVKNALAKSKAEIEAARQTALSEPLLRDRLIAADSRATGINVTLQLPLKTPNEVPEAVAVAREIAAGIEAKYPNISMRISGLAMMDNAFVEASINDITTLVPLMCAMIAVVMLVFLRSFAGTLAAFSVIALSCIAAMGLSGWIGIHISPPSASAPVIILTLAVADSIHFLTIVFREMHHGRERAAAIVESMRINFTPIFLTSLTTVIGFLSMNFSDAPPFRDLGNITSFGVVAAWVLSIFFLPALLAVIPLRVRPVKEKGTTVDRFADFVIARQRPLLWIMAAFILGLIAFIPKIELNDQFVRYFSPNIQFRRDTDFTNKHLTGIYQIEYSLSAGGTGAIAEPDYLTHLESFARWYRAQPETINVNTLSDTMKRLNRNMHGDDPSWYRIPDNRQLAAQYLLLYEMSLPFGLDLNNQINVDKSATRFIATIGEATTRGMRNLEARAEDWMDKNLPPSMRGAATGAPLMFSYISQRNIETMLVGTVIAFVLISLVLMATLRSLKIGLISLVPNMVPAAMAFGLWGLVVGRVGMSVSVIAAISLGIVVDDTIHFLSKYLRGRREHGYTPAAAVRYAFSTVGAALVATTVILIGGFLVLATSDFAINAKLGLLSAIAIGFALIVDFLLLPPLLMKIEEKPHEKTEAVPEPE